MLSRRRPASNTPSTAPSGTPSAAPSWSREKLLALLIGTAVACVVLVAGVVLFVVREIVPSHDAGAHATPATNTSQSAGSRSGVDPRSAAVDPRDALADKPMPAVDDEASHPTAISTKNPGVIAVPAATTIGPAQVPTGFPHTPAGALAQLAAIDQVAFQSRSLADARTVINSWAARGGPTSSSWSLLQGMATLFTQLGTTGTASANGDGFASGNGSGGGAGQIALVLTPVMGQIKGNVGADFTIPCIDFELDVTLQQTARGADADCQRMVWTRATTPGATPGSTATARSAGRWMIAAGAEPSTAPSVWPDTDLAVEVGYRDLRPEHHR